MSSERDAVIDELVEAAGGVVALGASLGLSRGAVSQWSRVPIEHCLELERQYGISRYRQRPDIYGEPPALNGRDREGAAA